MKIAWQESSEGEDSSSSEEVVWEGEGEGAGGHSGERRRTECPARDEMGILKEELGKRFENTWGVQAPAAKSR